MSLLTTPFSSLDSGLSPEVVSVAVMSMHAKSASGSHGWQTSSTHLQLHQLPAASTTPTGNLRYYRGVVNGH